MPAIVGPAEEQWLNGLHPCQWVEERHRTPDGDNLAELRTAIMEWKPDIAFNLLEEFQGIVTYDQHVVAFLELMKLRTANASGLSAAASLACIDE